MLRDLGISEARLQNSLIEVWNKTDLLPSDIVTDRQAELVPDNLSHKGDDDISGTAARLQFEVQLVMPSVPCPL